MGFLIVFYLLLCVSAVDRAVTLIPTCFVCLFNKMQVLHIWWVCRFLCDFYLKVRAVEIHQVGIWDVCHLPFSLAPAYQIAGSTGLINQGAAPKRKNKYCSGFMESLYYYTAGDLNVFI